MKYRYGKFVPDLLDELDMDELMSKLSDLLLASGFSDPYFSGTDDERTMQALYDAILDALLSGGVLAGRPAAAVARRRTATQTRSSGSRS